MSRNPTRDRRRTRTKLPVVVVEAPTEQSVVPYDEGLFERARTQWLFGDWRSLAKLDRDALEHHPNRGKLALFAAAGQLQIGGVELAHQLIRLALDWGVCNKQLLTILAAGAHNSLGRAAAHTGDTPRALKHFEAAVQLGAAGADVRLVMRARVNEQFVQLGLKVPEKSTEALEGKFKRNSLVSFKVGQSTGISQDAIDLFFSTHEGDRARSLDYIKKAVTGKVAQGELPDLSWGYVEHRTKSFFFIHLAGDYIPAKMAEKRQFYESPFLNLLARLHQPGKLIVDGGANIGNHTVFFAGVIGAPVIAFEPQPYNFSLLVTNVRLNKLEGKVDVRNTALGDRAGHVSLVQALPGNFGSFTADKTLVKVNDMETCSCTSFDVEISTIDTQLTDYENAISIIKLDLEGMELEALRGARSVIAESLPVIAVECFTRSMYQEIKEFLAPWNYFVIDSTNATPTFIFLSRSNPYHVERLSKYLEMSSVGKFSSNSTFNETAS